MRSSRVSKYVKYKSYHFLPCKKLAVISFAAATFTLPCYVTIKIAVIMILNIRCPLWERFLRLTYPTSSIDQVCIRAFASTAQIPPKDSVALTATHLQSKRFECATDEIPYWLDVFSPLRSVALYPAADISSDNFSPSVLPSVIKTIDEKPPAVTKILTESQDDEAFFRSGAFFTVPMPLPFLGGLFMFYIDLH